MNLSSPFLPGNTVGLFLWRSHIWDVQMGQRWSFFRGWDWWNFHHGSQQGWNAMFDYYYRHAMIIIMFDYSHDLLIIDMPWQNAVILSDYIINHLPWNIPTCPLNTHDIPTIVPWYSNYIINSHCYPTVIPIFSLQIRSYPSPWFSSWRCNTTKTRLVIFPPVTVFFALLAEVPWVRRNHICSMCYITI